MRALTADYRKNLVTFQSFSLCVLPLPPQNEIRQQSRFFCYSKLVVYSVWVEESVATGFNKSKKCHASFYSRVQEKFLTSLLAFRACIQGEPM